MPSPTCLTSEDIDNYTAGELSPERAERVREHLEQCEVCKQLIEESGAHAHLLAQLRDAVEHDEVAGQLPRRDAQGTGASGGVPEHADDVRAEPSIPIVMPKKIGQFHIKRVIATGGMGTVYEAVQEHPRRTVAVKMMRHGIASRNALRRFEYESQILARLRHPGIAHIYEAGTHDDGGGAVPYFAMEYIPNARPIIDHVKLNKLSTPERLQLFVQVCEAVHHGHQKGIIHRDLKPGNILVDSHGWVKIIDFGVARATDSDMTLTTLQTEVGQLLGTVQYMSPEQCEADPHDLDTRSDVYALGVVLYELLCEKPPYDVSTVAVFEATRLIREQQPTRLSAIDRTLRGDLETVVFKALEKDRERRYQSPGELGRDIRHYLAGEAIEAKRDSFTYVLHKQLRKHKVAVMAALTLVTVVTAGFVTSLTFWIRAEAERERLQRTVYFKQIGLSQAAYDANEIARMKQFLRDCRAHPRGWEWYRLFWLSDRSEGTLRGHAGSFRWSHEAGVRCAAFSPDGRRIASGGWDKTVRIWDATTREEILPPLIGHKRTVASVAYSPDGMSVVSGSWDTTLKIWDASTGEETLILPGHEDAVLSVAYSPDGRLIASGSTDKTLKIWNASTGENKRTLRGHTEAVNCVAFGPEGRWIVSGSDDKTVKVWDAATGKERTILRGHELPVDSVAYSPDGRSVVSGSADQTLKVWDAITGEELRTLTGHKAEVWAVGFAPNGKQIVSGGADRVLRIWDARTGEEKLTLYGHDFPVTSASFSPDGQWILSASEDFTVRLWDVNTEPDSRPLYGHKGSVRSVALSPDGKLIVSGSDDKTIKVWDTNTGLEARTLRGHELRVSSVAFSNDNRWIISGSHDKTLKVWAVGTGEEVSTLRGHGSGVRCVAFSNDNRWIVSGSADKTVRIWDAMTGEEAQTLRGHKDEVVSVAYSPDDTRIASASHDNTVKVWDANTGQNKLTLRGHKYPVTSVAFSPDGTRIVSGSWDNTVRVWNASTGAQILKRDAHEYDVYSVAFSPDGERIISGSADRTVKVWHASTGEEALTLRGHKDGVLSVAFSPDGTRIVSGCQDNTVRIWNSGMPRNP